MGTTLALVGIYGRIAYSVTRRTREIGIRLSIGTQRGQVLWMFILQSLALMLAASIRKMLFALSP